jgi:subtilisin family serine protease
MRLMKALVALTLVAFAFTVRPSAQSASGRAVAGEIIVKFRPGASDSAKADAHRAGGGRQLTEIARTNVQVVAVSNGDEQGAIARYRRNPNVLYAEPNFIRTVPKPISHGPGTEILPGDYYFNEQWAVHNTGQLFYCIIPGFPEFCFYVGTPDADVDGPEAWAISTGAGVKVAVIDTGIDYTHPDLAANFIGGEDFVNGDLDPMDDHGHGTHVSGTIAARLNNLTGTPADEEGVVGVAPDAQILSYKVCRSDGTCSDSAIELAIYKAIADGAKVINMSLGGPDYSQSLDDAVQDAWNAGLVIVAGAGNDGTTAEFYPAANQNVISVGAFDEDHGRATFSNFGTWVDISAPGNVILSSYPMYTCASTLTPGDFGCYTWNSGTSMATPHVAGAAALVWSRGDVTSNSQVVDILLTSADPQGVGGVPLNSWTIHGGLNIHNALSFGVTNVPPVANAGPDQSVTDTNGNGSESVTLNGSGSSDTDGTIVSYEWREGAAVIGTGATPTISFAVGAHTVTLQVTDDEGATDTDTVLITVNSAGSPTANAGPDQTVTDSNGDGTEQVTLNGSASFDPDGTIVLYEWREGTLVGTGVTVAVSFAVGTHTVTLHVTDDDGGTATDTVIITVNPAPPPNVPPVANAGPDQSVTDTNGNGSESVTLNGSGSSDTDGTIVSYEWREGAVLIGTGATPTISFALGAHTVTLQVTDDDGATATDTVFVAVNSAPNQAPVANAGPDQTVTDTDGNGSEPVTLNGSGSSDADGTIVSYEWREGVSTIGTGATPTISFAVGTHTVTLFVIDDDGTIATDSVVITVNPGQPPSNVPPTANAGPDQSVTDTNGNGSESVTLNGSGSSDSDGTIVSYEWREGAVLIGTGATPTISFALGAHTVTLQVTDDDGATATDTVVVSVNSAPNQAPVANAGPDQTVTDTDGNGSEPVTLNGSGSSDTDGTIVSYEWREGVSTIGTGATPTISFAVGTHTVTLFVIDDDGTIATDSVVITVNPAPPPPNVPPSANAGPDQSVTDANFNGSEPVTLNGSASTDPDGTIVGYEWREGSIVLGTGATPTALFAVGTHTVTLRVTDDDGATGTDTVVITVNPAPNQTPHANAGLDQTVTDANGDGSDPVVLNGAGSWDPDGSLVSYEWREGAALIGTGATPTVSFAVGTHTVTLQVTDDDGATATDTVVITVNPAPPPPNVAPTANAGPDQSATDTNGNGSESVTLNGSGSSDTDGTIVSYEWREGAALIGTGTTPTVSFAVGTHTVTLQVTDDDGATATDTVVITVNPAPPPPNVAPTANAGPNQSATDTNGNGSESVTLNGSGSSDSDGTIVSYEWREGAALIGTGTTPTISFAVGTHTVTLQVTDDDGATATDTVVVTVNPAPAPSTVHVGDLDGSSTSNRNEWTARVTATVHNTNHQPVSGAVVTGSWSGGVFETGSCTTNASGTCVITSSSMRKRENSATFTVVGIAASGLSYSVGDNHEPDGDSTGTAITILKP